MNGSFAIMQFLLVLERRNTTYSLDMGEYSENIPQYCTEIRDCYVKHSVTPVSRPIYIMRAYHKISCHRDIIKHVW